MDVDAYVEAGLVHEIHTSVRKSFRGCRRRWDWIFRQNYYPSITAKPLEFGVAFHKAMEKYYDPKTWSYPKHILKQFAVKAFVDKAEEQRKHALAVSGEQYLESEVQEDYDERVELGRGMLEHFFTRVAPKEDRGWTPVKVEIPFMVAIPHPETGDTIYCKCQECRRRFANYYKIPARASDRTEAHKKFLRQNWVGLPVVLAGRCDMVATDGQNYFIADWKTAAQIRDDDEFLYLDDQIGSYVYALWKLGLPVRGFVYYEIRKGFPKSPTKNKMPRLGRMFSVNRTQETSYELYLETVSQEDKEAYEAGLYDDFLQYLKNEGIIFHRRRLIFKTVYELAEIERNLGYEALEMINPNIAIYPSPGRFSCTTCAFRTPCLEKNAGGDYEYALKTMYEKREHYYVRTEPSTESKGGE